MSSDSFDDDDQTRFRQRIWGAIVLFAIAIIVLPLLLDGAGSESQFRRVERLREAPTSHREDAPTAEIVTAPEKAAETPDIVAPVTLPEQTSSLKAWVVEAGRFSAQTDAIELRNRLRQAGYASFVRQGARSSTTPLNSSERADAASPEPFDVLVGPMIKEVKALQVSQRIARLLNTDATVSRYP